MKTKTCEGCIHHSYRCGLGASIARMMGVTNPNPVWICKALNAEWERDIWHLERRAKRRVQCVEQGLYEKEANH
jgi:hypothetical protein